MIEVGSACDPGIKRKGKPNQDTIGMDLPKSTKNDKTGLFIVADGMGGFQEGAKASQLTVNEFIKAFKNRIWKKNWEEILIKGMTHSHKKIKNFVKKHPDVSNMGTTVAAVIIDKNKMHLLNVGDSRIYLVNEEEINQISYDHSLVAEQVRHGVIKPEEALNHPRRNMLLLSISSKHEKINPFMSSKSLKKDDLVILCSDGLWGPVSDSQIKDVVLELPPQDAADKLIKMANMNQGPDNISVIIIKIV